MTENATAILEIVSHLVSRGLSHADAIEATHFIVSQLGPIPTSGRSPRAKREYERARKADYRARKVADVPQNVPGHRPGQDLEYISSKTQTLLVNEEKKVIKKEKKDSGCPIVPRDKSDWPTDGFDQFWSVAPRKVGKADARRAFDRVRISGEVPWARFWAGVLRWVAESRHVEIQYVKHPATWLRKGCWEDEATQRAPGQRASVKKTGGNGFARLLARDLTGEGEDYDGQTIDGTAVDLAAGSAGGPRGEPTDLFPH